MEAPKEPRYVEPFQDTQERLSDEMRRADHYDLYDADENERVARELWGSLSPAFHKRVKKILTAETGGEHGN